MKTLDEYYKMILISTAIVVFLPLTTLMAEDYWDWSTYATSDQSPDIYESTQWVTKIVDIDETYCERNFDEVYGKGFNMTSEWDIDITAYVENPPEEAYSNCFELEGEAYHYCQEDWEWTGPPTSAPGATIDFDLNANGYLSTIGYIAIVDGTPYIGATGDIFCNAYSWPHDSQGSGYLEVNVGVSGSVSDSSYSSDVLWDTTPAKDPPSPWNYVDEDEFEVRFYYWSFGDDGYYEVESGIGTFSANGGAYAKGEASVGLIADEGDTGYTEVEDDVHIYAYSSFGVNLD